MKPRSSRVLRVLRAGGFATMFKAGFADPRGIEVAGLCGVDSIWLCHEHVPADWVPLENQVRAARLHDVDTIVRVSRGSYSDYIRPLEAGATGLMVPHVASEEEARQIVDWTRFHPLGRRALDGGSVDGHFGMLPLEEYLRVSNAERVLIFQIESPEALENVEAIAAVPGFDVLLFGPGDFSHRLGKAGQFDAPEVVAARKRVAAAARAHGKHAMSVLLSPFPELAAEGFRYFNVGSDAGGMAAFLRQRLASLDEMVRALPPQPSP